MKMVKEKLSERKDEIRNRSSDLCLPSDCSNKFSSYALSWLNQYLDEDDIFNNKIQWSEKTRSIVFPIYQGRTLVMYQQRYFSGNRKWKTSGAKTEYILGSGDILVLVEDIISAIKVCHVTAAMPLFGSNVSIGSVLRLSKLHKECRIWLDKDKAKDSINYSAAACMIMPTKSIITDLDPKCYNIEEIRRLCV